MPRIISELNGLNLYSWVTTAYLLTSTVMVPIWGKLGDIFGRKPVLITGITIFLAGSWLSGISGEFGTILGVPGMVRCFCRETVPRSRGPAANVIKRVLTVLPLHLGPVFVIGGDDE